MWTAVSLAALIVAGTLGYAAWAVHAVGNGARWWLFVLGYPLVYLAVPFAFTALWVFLGSVLRGERPAEVALTVPQRVRLFWNEFVALAQSAPKMILYRWLMPEPAPAPRRTSRSARAWRRLQCRRVGWPAPLSGCAGAGTDLCHLLRSPARVDRDLRRPARRADRGDSPGHRRRAGARRRPQHGRSRCARLPAQVRRRRGAPAGHDRHAAPGQPARVDDDGAGARRDAAVERVSSRIERRHRPRRRGAGDLAVVVARLDGRTAGVVAPRLGGQRGDQRRRAQRAAGRSRGVAARGGGDPPTRRMPASGRGDRDRSRRRGSAQPRRHHA